MVYCSNTTCVFFLNASSFTDRENKIKIPCGEKERKMLGGLEEREDVCVNGKKVSVKKGLIFLVFSLAFNSRTTFVFYFILFYVIIIMKNYY